MDEIWKDIEGYEGSYQISNLGRIRSFDRLVLTLKGYYKPIKGVNKKLNFDKDGYLITTLSKNRTPKSFKLHRLVLQTFKPTEDILLEINHINGVKDDNRLTNLEWVTKKQNQQHSIELGLRNDRGENSKNSKLTTEQAMEIKYGLVEVSLSDISKTYKVVKSVICNIRSGKTWKHI